MASIPHWEFPFRVVDGVIPTVEQDTPQEIAQCVKACLQTPIGSRVDAPAYGRPDESFKTQPPKPSAESYLEVVAEAEPRARLIGEARIEEMVERVVIKPEVVR